MFAQEPVMTVHSSFIWNSQKLETTQMSFDRTEPVVEYHTAITKQRLTDMCSSLEETPEQCAE